MDQYAVVGYPVAHSRSPFIHASFAEQTGQRLEYGTLEVKPEGFQKAVADFFSRGGKGLNITVPHKQAAWQMAEIRAASAERGGAVNTLFQRDGILVGDNTDGVGLVRDIEQNNGTKLKGARLMILGAGGAVRGVIPRLLDCRPASLTIVNRTLSRAEALARQFANELSIETCSYQQLLEITSGATPDWIINGSSAGLQGEMPDLPDWLVAPGTACYDMVYAAGGTVFQRWAQQRGAAHALDGTGMLVEQAAESFRLWRGVMPDTAPVLSALREQLSQGLLAGH